MVAHIDTVAFSGIDVLPIEVQVAISGGLPTFAVVGLPDKAVGESRERVRAALSAIGLALPAKRITVNLGSIATVTGVLPAAIGTNVARADLPERARRRGGLGQRRMSSVAPSTSSPHRIN